MKQGVHIEQLLRWRTALAEREASPRPRAAELIAALRPWWERWPELFRARVVRLSAMPLAYGYAMAGSDRATGYPVPAMIVGSEDAEAYARVLYFSVRVWQLRLRFSLDDAALASHDAFEATLVDDASGIPIALARAERGQTGEYRLDATLPEQVAQAWETLRVTDRMPFRLILEPAVRVRAD